MKQLLILSGKGGTGKTTIASAFVKLAQAKAVADCDVDAPNLHLVMGDLPTPVTKDYFGLDKAQIDLTLCTECDLCRQHCRFGAIKIDNGYKVDLFACEGCGVCEFVCPVQAATLVPAVAGELMLYQNENVFSTAQLKMGSGNSGLLVTEVKKGLQQAKDKTELAIIDGSPGIGCPVIASMSGVDLVLMVAEPSLSGISDLKRIMQTADKFQLQQVVCVNKYDANKALTDEIAKLCAEQEIPFVGRIPFDPVANRAVNKGLSIVDVPCPAEQSVRDIFKKTMDILFS